MVSPQIHMDAVQVEKVQRRAIKTVVTLMNLPYEETREAEYTIPQLQEKAWWVI
jgi:hypothetical protein